MYAYKYQIENKEKYINLINKAKHKHNNIQGKLKYSYQNKT